VVPVYGCAGCLDPLVERLGATLGGTVASYEIILVDDRSPDGAWDVIRRLARVDPSIRALRLSRNFGQTSAITAGLAEARARWAVVMDCDLQEPPEAIPQLLAKAREGYDIVHTRRRCPRHSRLRRTLSRTYFRLRDALNGTSLGSDHGTMSVLSRPVIDAFLALPDRDREYLALLGWLGFEQTTVEVDHAERHAGRSSYGWQLLVRVAVDGLFFQTTVFLRWIVLAGFLVAGLGALVALYDLSVYLSSNVIPGYTSLAVLVLFMSGIILVSVGVIGLYVGKTFEQAKGRPLYIVDTRLEPGAPAERAVERRPTTASTIDRERLFAAFDRHYAPFLREHGPTPRGVDCNSKEAQEIRFAQLIRVVEPSEPFSVLDYGCGYGALAGFMRDRGLRFTYIGYDVSQQMLAVADRSDPSWHYTSREEELEPVDYVLASGLFNLRLGVDDAAWRNYIVDTIATFGRLARRGFAFNMLTRYSDPERMRADLYYGDPCFFFDLCKREHGREVALLHDYGIHDFTILVRRR
jgi:polyisoprenyl-phosphate glycosyltransferase